MKKIILYIATTADGFIADKNGNLDWLPQTTDETDGEDFGYQEFLNSIDTIVLGKKTYEQIMTFVDQGHVPDWPYIGKTTYVFTQQSLHSNNPEIVFIQSIKDFLEIIKLQPEIQNIWLCGGAKLIDAFAQKNLIDTAIITFFPKNLHDGIALPNSVYDKLNEVDSKIYKNNVIQKTYTKKLCKNK